ncbi:MAG: GNAT family N-acetyltransferase [Bacteroidetes bacterium]|jgi:GNAT superfamily N-acetyltransferase|nr:GNAT family N-acetyltransferase [Bacteroidota bacterium]
MPFSPAPPSIQVLPLARQHLAPALSLIKELAAYERAEHEMVLGLHTFTQDWEQGRFQAWVAMVGPEVKGLALCYPVYSTWKGLSLHLEDIIVSQSHRRAGLGRLLFAQVVAEAGSINAGRLEWQVLDWNKDAIAFYNQYEASYENQWLNARLGREKIMELIKAQ